MSEKGKELAVLKDYLQKKDLKLTYQRREILDKFLRREEHITAEELYHDLKKKNPKIGFSTVYRALKLLREAGLVKEVDFDERKARFEHKYAHSHHDHLICIKCGKAIEFLNNEIEKLQEKITKKYKFRVKTHKMEIYGHCKNCY